MADTMYNLKFTTIASVSSNDITVDDPSMLRDDLSAFIDADFLVWAAGETPTPSNSEYVRPTADASGTFTLSRQQQGSSLRTIQVGDYIALTPSKKVFDDLQSEINTAAASEINDAATTTTNTWSADKISTEIAAGGGGSSKSQISFNSIFEDPNRFSATASGASSAGANFGATGNNLTSGSTSAGYARLSFRSLTIAAWDGNSEFAAFISHYTNSANGDLDAYWGVGELVTAAGGVTFTGKHYGFKSVRSGGTTTYYYTNADGTTETAASFGYSETSTIWLAKKTGTTSIKYYKDGTLLGTVTTNLPSGSTQYPVSFSMSNKNSNTGTTYLQMMGFNYRKDAE